MHELIKRYIFTGAPGSGKTTLLQELEKTGHKIIPEAVTDLIQIEQEKGIVKPWEAHDFIPKIIFMQKQRQESATSTLQLYDRSPFCTYALWKFLNPQNSEKSQPPPILNDEIQRCLEKQIYEKSVFFLENLGFIENTSARKISFEQALHFERLHKAVYQKFGFKVMSIKADTLNNRVQIIEELLKFYASSLSNSIFKIIEK